MAKESGSAKRSGRMCTSLGGKCLGEPERAKFFEAEERLIKVRAKEPYKYTWTKRRNTARQRRARQKKGLATLFHCSGLSVCVALSGRVNRKMAFQGDSEIQHKQRFLKLWFPAGECKLYRKILRSWGISVFWTTFAAGLELLSLTYTIIVQTRTPGTAAWHGPKQPPSCLSRESSHKTQAVSLPLCIRLHLYHTSLHWLM